MFLVLLGIIGLCQAGKQSVDLLDAVVNICNFFSLFDIYYPSLLAHHCPFCEDPNDI